MKDESDSRPSVALVLFIVHPSRSRWAGGERLDGKSARSLTLPILIRSERVSDSPHDRV